VPAFLGAGARHFGFMLRGLKELAAEAEAKGIAFFMLQVHRCTGQLASMMLLCMLGLMLVCWSVRWDRLRDAQLQ
jgi:hypothetical protein